MGVEVSAAIDSRAKAESAADYPLIHGQVIRTSGRFRLREITIKHNDGRESRLPVQALGVAGEWNPNVHSTRHKRSRPRWQDYIVAFVSGENLTNGVSGGTFVAAAAAGKFDTSAVI